MIEIYILLLAVPITHILGFVIRCLRHFKDGKNRTRYISNVLLTKLICTVLMIFFCCIHTAEAVLTEMYSFAVYYTRILFFIMLTLCWILSLYLLNFENQRWIGTTWIGNKGF